MSAFTFFKALEKLSDLESAKKNGHIKIPDYFIKLVLLNKTKLLQEQLNKKILKELFVNRHLINKNFPQPKMVNFFLANQKYKSLQRISKNMENSKSNSPLPKIDQRKSLLNLRYKDKEKYNNELKKNKLTNKEIINIKTRRAKLLNNINNIGNNSINNSSIKTESIIPNKNVKEIYIITKRFNNRNNNYNTNNNSISNNNSDSKKINGQTFYKQKNINGNDIITTTELNPEKEKENNSVNLRMTFITPLSRSMVSKHFERNNNIPDILMNELSKNNSSKKFSPKFDINNVTTKNYFPKLKININNDVINNNINNSNHINNNRNSERISEYNYYQINKNLISRTIKDKEEDNLKNYLNNSLIIDKTNDKKEIIDINNTKDEKQKERSLSLNKRNNLINIRKPNLKEFQININMKQIRKINFNNNTNNLNIQPTNTRRITKISLQNNNNTKSNQMILIPEFKNNYISQEDFEKKLNKNKILFPLNTNISLNNSNDKFYFFINKMYRNQLNEYMQHRINWESVTKINNDEQKIINFAWKYMSNRLNFKNYKYEPNKPSKKLRMVNLFERNYEVGNKKNMFINLINYCDQININVFDLVPFTVIINNTKDVDYCLEALSDLIKFVNKNKNINKNIITNKLYNDHFWFDKNFENLKRQYINIDKNFLSNKNYWILKPTDLYQGKCIEISNSFEEISKKCRNMFKGVEKKFVPEEIIREEDLSDDENNNKNNININNNKDIYEIKILNESPTIKEKSLPKLNNIQELSFSINNKKNEKHFNNLIITESKDISFIHNSKPKINLIENVDNNFELTIISNKKNEENKTNELRVENKFFEILKKNSNDNSNIPLSINNNLQIELKNKDENIDIINNQNEDSEILPIEPDNQRFFIFEEIIKPKEINQIASHFNFSLKSKNDSLINNKNKYENINNNKIIILIIIIMIIIIIIMKQIKILLIILQDYSNIIIL